MATSRKRTDAATCRYADFFCGLGAFHTAFEMHNKTAPAGVRYECVVACDIDEGARKLYHENYGLMPLGDIHEVEPDDLPDFDVLCAGFPCQPFSIAGKKEGFGDKNKGNLFMRIMEIADAKKPRTIVLENVRNLRTIHGGETFRTIVRELETRGYKVTHRIMDSKHFGSPQSRQRIFIVADLARPFEFPDILVPNAGGYATVRGVIDADADTPFFDYDGKYDLVRLPPGSRGMMTAKLVNRRTKKGGRQGERVYSLDKPGPTICASSGGPGAKTGLYDFGDDRIRTLTPKEGLRMFGFPDTYRHESLRNPNRLLFYLGNSIVVNVVEAIIPRLR